MSKLEKVRKRLLSKPKDFTWNELKTLLSAFGYLEKAGSGSRRKFIHQQTQHTIILHEPHPRPVLKMYAVRYILEELKKQKLL